MQTKAPIPFPPSPFPSGGAMPVRFLAGLLALAALGALGGCAGEMPVRQSAAEEPAQSASGPTLYGRLGVSVDHVSTD